MEITTRIIYLLQAHVRQLLDTNEAAELQAWAGRHPSFQQLLDEVSDEESLIAALRAFDHVYGGDTVASIARMEERIAQGVGLSSKEPSSSVRPFRLHKWLPYAAAIVIAATMATWFFYGNRTTSSPQLEVDLAKTDIAPGGNRATLKLADGSTIDLDETQTGIVVGAEEITYLDGSALDVNKFVPGEVSASEADGGLAISLLELTTPKGGTYQVTLPDGTKVWLNAASSIKYPNRFVGNERVVEISGEAFFSVAKNKRMPFKVMSNGQIVEVVGTEFNISAYHDEIETKTTLVEGAVKVTPNAMLGDSQANLSNSWASGLSDYVLKPGEQATARGTQLEIQQVDIERYIAWKKGYFYFKHTPFEEVMRQLARWYDVDVVYKNSIPRETFTGELERDLTLNAVLKILNVSAIQVQIMEGGKVTVY